MDGLSNFSGDDEVGGVHIICHFLPLGPCISDNEAWLRSEQWR